MGGYARCYNCGYTVAKDEDTLCDVCRSPSDNNYTEPLIAERDRLAAENEELRKERDAWQRASTEWSEKCVRTECDRDKLKFELAAANATLDALREAVRTGFNNQEVAQRVLEILYPQPKETTDDER